jgi:D-alanyl-D-alanine carboxypeptidase/D-alanyl-D-alanine-endopeptidase (penicillin-binding protein 4)
LKAQSIKIKLQEAYRKFEADSQLKHAISSLYVIEEKTGNVVFDKNSQIGLAPASTQKIITAATAFELLGKDYRYKTIFTLDSNNLYVAGFGDPSFGSWRYDSFNDTTIFKNIIDGLKQAKINQVNDLIVYDNDLNRIPPSTWIYEDIANYYGAPAREFNWHENQYDLTFIPGKNPGDDAMIDTSATIDWQMFINNCKTGLPGSGDNCYIYFVPGSQFLYVDGTVPPGSKRFSISGADISPAMSFSVSFKKYARARNFLTSQSNGFTITPRKRSDSAIYKRALYTYYSPSLDTIIYWFLQKSINLYGEALIKTLSSQRIGFDATDSGVMVVKDFWKRKGLDPEELNIKDGSGLSPQNRMTTHAQVEILKYAKHQSWFPYFFNALPEYNNMKMKSGSISDVKGFCGYQAAGNGTQYIFSFLVNNFSGSSSSVINKMYKVLDVLK